MVEERDGRLDLNELIGLIDTKTRLVAISHVQYASGFRANLERLGRAARAVDTLLVVDVIQALGVVPIDVQAETRRCRGGRLSQMAADVRGCRLSLFVRSSS